MSGELTKLIERLRADAQKAVPPEYADRQMHGKYLRLDNEAAGWDSVADELEEIAPRYEALEAQNALLLEALRAVEWGSTDEYGEMRCGACKNLRAYGHTPTCIVGKALASSTKEVNSK